MITKRDLLNFLSDTQLPNGAWPITSGTGLSLKKSSTVPSPFFTSLTLQLLAELGEAVDPHYLMSQRSAQGTWNIWEKPQPAGLPTYPDDLDDTIAAYTALHIAGALTPPDYAMLTRALITCETKPSGPYRTWLVPPTSEAVWLDVDPCVNAAIAVLANKLSLTLPGLDAYLEECLETSALSSPYYPTNHCTLWHLSRIEKYAGDTRLQNAISQQLNSPTFPLLLAAKNCQIPFVHIPNPLEAEALSYEFREKNIEESRFNGSAAFSAAAMLTLLQQKQPTPETLSPAKKNTTPLALRALKYVKSLPKEHQRVIQPVVNQVLAQEVTTTGFADMVFSALKPDAQKKITKEARDELRFATLLGWVSYTLLDTAYDTGNPMSVPAAMVVNRDMRLHFAKACPNPEFLEWFDKTLITMDAVNAQEMRKARVSYPDAQPLEVVQLGERALGHGAASVALLTLAKCPTEAFITYATHYLVARQLDDDAHDWQEDLENNQLTPVVSWIRATNKPDPSVAFWEEVIDVVAKTVAEHTEIATEALRDCEAFLDTRPLLQALSVHTKAMEKAIAKRNETKQFTNTLFGN